MLYSLISEHTTYESQPENPKIWLLPIVISDLKFHLDKQFQSIIFQNQPSVIFTAFTASATAPTLAEIL